MVIHRYKKHRIVSSSLDPLQDVVSWVKGFQSEQFLKEIVKERHSTSSFGAVMVNERISTSCAHIATACAYLDQALNGPESVSFLPLYYAFLNLAKVYVILGPYAKLLRTQRRHGVSYDPTGQGKDLLKEKVQLWNQGAIPLFYLTITGNALPHGTTIEMSQVYPYLFDVGAEYEMITGKHSSLRPASIKVKEDAGYWRIECTLEEGQIPLPHANDRKYLPAIKGLRRYKGNTKVLVSKRFPDDKGMPPIDSLRNTISTFLICAISSNPPEGPEFIYPVFLPISKKPWLPFEEFLILLAFFHLSSVIRYHPEFHQDLMQSRYWPMLLVLIRHATYKFLLLFFSFIMQESTYVLT